MPKPGRPKSEGIPYPIKPYLTIEQSDWLDRQINKSQAIANLIQQQIYAVPSSYAVDINNRSPNHPEI